MALVESFMIQSGETINLSRNTASDLRQLEGTRRYELNNKEFSLSKHDEFMLKYYLENQTLRVTTPTGTHEHCIHKVHIIECDKGGVSVHEVLTTHTYPGGVIENGGHEKMKPRRQQLERHSQKIFNNITTKTSWPALSRKEKRLLRKLAWSSDSDSE